MALHTLKRKTVEFLTPCPQRLALLWFWSTVTTTFYCGIFHVLPLVYSGKRDWLLTLERLLAAFLLVEMVVNWLCLRLVSSRYWPPESDLRPLPANRVAGFEIDLDRLRSRPREEGAPSGGHETYSLPLSSIRPVGEEPLSGWNHDTMYLVSMHADEACYVTSGRTLGKRIDLLLLSGSSEDPEGGNRRMRMKMRRRRRRRRSDLELGSGLVGSPPSESCLRRRESANGMGKRPNRQAALTRKDGKGTESEEEEEETEEDREEEGVEEKRRNDDSPKPRTESPREKGLVPLRYPSETGTRGENGNENGNGGGNGRAGGRVVVYPYWSWKPCLPCGFLRPPRAHHCRLCGHCVLKRDHHCFFAAACIGLRNQRHFVVFLFWSSLAMAFSLVQSALYVATRCFLSGGEEEEEAGGRGERRREGGGGGGGGDVDTLHCLGNVILPVTAYRFLLAGAGAVSGGGDGGRGADALDLTLVLVLYSVVWFFLVCCGFLVEQARLIAWRSTSFERENSIRVVRKVTVSGSRSREGSPGDDEETTAFKYAPGDPESSPRPKVGAGLARWNRSLYWIFGPNWFLNFLLPLHFVYETPEDGITWKSIE